MSHSPSPPPKVFWVMVAVLVMVAATPTLIVLFHAALPFLIVLAVAVVVIRLVWFHTRRW